ncbi:hypothetical protein D3C72_1731100 [compost metagenome]
MLGTVGGAALLDLVQAVVQRADQHLAALGIFQQVVLQVGIAADHPDIAQHLVQHAGRAAGAALAAQLVQDAPGFLAQQADDNLAVREGRVVIGNFTQARRGVLRGELGVEHEWGVHGGDRFLLRTGTVRESFIKGRLYCKARFRRTATKRNPCRNKGLGVTRR